MTVDPARWYPVAAAADMPPRHVYQTRLGGYPLAIWRGADATINVWEDRCPHRGARFSIGQVVGDALRCQYHGWRFASRSGACTAIPAQPRTKPASAIRAAPRPAYERDGLVWTGLAPAGAPPELGAREVGRALPIWSDAATVEAALPTIPGVTLYVQPVDWGRSVVRPVIVAGDVAAVDAILEALRRRLEPPCPQ